MKVRSSIPPAAVGFTLLVTGCPIVAGPEGAPAGKGGDGEPSPEVSALGSCESRVLYDGHANGSYDYAGRLGYDGAGRVVAYEEVLSGTKILRTDRTFDSAGRLVEHREETTEGSPFPDVLSTFAYDGQGRLSSARWESSELAPRTGAYSYDAESRPLRDEFDTDDDGQVDSINVYLWSDSEPLELEVLHDYDADGIAEGYLRRVYVDGRPVLDEHYLGTELQAVNRYTYDPLGHMIRHELDLPVGDPIEHTATYEYDDDGRLVHEVYDTDSDGALDQITDRLYDDAGRLTTIERWSAGYYFDATHLLFWEGDDLVRIEQRGREDGVLHLQWALEDECGFSMHVNRYPIGGYEMFIEEWQPQTLDDLLPFWDPFDG